MVKRLIERPIAVTMSIIAIVVLGFISMRYLPVSLMPDIDIPQISVHVSAPGMSVREVNDQLLRPLRNQLMQVIGLESISTEARSDMGILWFGVDDAATSSLTPIYSVSNAVPEAWGEESGTMLKYSSQSAFWIFNQTTNFAYMNYNSIAPDINTVTDAWESQKLVEVEDVDAAAAALKGEARVDYLTKYSVDTAQELFARWGDLFGYLMTKHMDGNLKAENGTVLDYLDGDMSSAHFVNNGNRGDVPDKISTPGYSEKWQRAVANDNGEILKMVE